MNTNVINPIRLKNLYYADICSQLSHVCFGNYQLPIASDECYSVNSEYSFLLWKQKMILKYPNALVALNPKESWNKRISIIDQSFQYDKTIYINSKSQFLKAEGVI